MPAAATDKFMYVGNPGTATTLSAPGYTIGATSITVGSTASFPSLTGTIFAIDKVTIVDGEEVQVSGSYCVFEGVVTSGTTIGSVSLLYGTPQDYPSGATTRVYITVSSQHNKRLIDGLLVSHDQDGTLKQEAVTEALGISGTAPADYTTIGTLPTTITANGQKSYDVLFPSVDLTPTLHPGSKLRFTRTVATPTQSALLNGTSQYFSKSSPAGMTWTDDFAAGAWVKLSSYAVAVILSRWNGTNGWEIKLNGSGQIEVAGYNASSANVSYVQSTQSIPLNKWVHITAQLDMSAYTATSTTSYVMIDGVDVPATVGRAGTNPTALVQAGNLEVGSRNGGLLPFPGKIKQAFVTSAKLTQANARLIYGQGITTANTTTYNMVSAFSLSGASGLTDLNTTNANNLTANGGATTTNDDSPWGQQSNGTISSTIEYGVVNAAPVYSGGNTTVTVQVPEGSELPTNGGISAVSYSNVKSPYGFPTDRGKWGLFCVLNGTSRTVGSLMTWYTMDNFSLLVPVGAWNVGYDVMFGQQNSTAGIQAYRTTLSTSTSAEGYADLTTGMVSRTSSTSMSFSQLSREKALSVAANTPFYFLGNVEAGSGTITITLTAGYGYQKIYAENAYI